ncbi:MAG: hypothetical protein GXP45_00380, partial [bacterium]|nr:hypothetical protein [bacterium]
MLKFGATIRIVLTIVLLSFPIGIGTYFLTKKIVKLIKFFIQKFHELKALDKMRKDILEKRVQENQEDDIWTDVDDTGN